MFWQSNEDWERERSNETEILARETDQSWDLIQQASKLDDSDPAAAFRLYVNAAEAGSVWALETVGIRYWNGSGVVTDLVQAKNYYRRAAAEGSWMAQIHYARLLSELQQHDECENVLGDCLASDFIPAYYWLARLRYDRCQTRTVANEIRPLLMKAAENGHPGSEVMLSKMMFTGKFGLREIPRGLLMIWRGALKFAGKSR